MREALALINTLAPELEVDGEMHGDAALVEAIRREQMPDSQEVTVGPVLMGVAKPVHILTPIASDGVSSTW